MLLYHHSTLCSEKIFMALSNNVPWSEDFQNMNGTTGMQNPAITIGFQGLKKLSACFQSRRSFGNFTSYRIKISVANHTSVLSRALPTCRADRMLLSACT